MLRRAFIKSLTALAGGFAMPRAAHASRETWKTLQVSPIAGFQYHNGEALWLQLAAGQPLTLTCEADNSFDERAVRVDWQSQKLGYLPRLDNAAVSQLLDRGEVLDAVIARLENSSNPWDRVRVEVRWMHSVIPAKVGIQKKSYWKNSVSGFGTKGEVTLPT